MINQIKLSKKQKLLDTLNSQIRACKKCNLSATRKHALTGEGNLNAQILFVALT
jgi:uracil-DNA glycosylase